MNLFIVVDSEQRSYEIEALCMEEAIAVVRRHGHYPVLCVPSRPIRIDGLDKLVSIHGEIRDIFNGILDEIRLWRQQETFPTSFRVKVTPIEKEKRK